MGCGDGCQFQSALGRSTKKPPTIVAAFLRLGVSIVWRACMQGGAPGRALMLEHVSAAEYSAAVAHNRSRCRVTSDRVLSRSWVAS